MRRKVKRKDVKVGQKYYYRNSLYEASDTICYVDCLHDNHYRYREIRENEEVEIEDNTCPLSEIKHGEYFYCHTTTGIVLFCKIIMPNGKILCTPEHACGYYTLTENSIVERYINENVS